MEKQIHKQLAGNPEDLEDELDLMGSSQSLKYDFVASAPGPGQANTFGVCKFEQEPASESAGALIFPAWASPMKEILVS